MSQSTKRKHVTKEVLDEFRLPANNEKIVQVIAGRGNNLHEVYDPISLKGEPTDNNASESCKYLVSMPTKFRKNVWIKRGDYVVVEPIEEGDKVKAEIVQILYKDQIKYIKDQGQWPAEFSKDTKIDELNVKPDDSQKESEENSSYNNSESESDDESDLFQNTNRPKVEYEASSDSSSAEDE